VKNAYLNAVRKVIGQDMSPHQNIKINHLSTLATSLSTSLPKGWKK
jgi:hypothetical protein